MNKEAGPQFGFKPGRFRRHYHVGVCQRHELLNGRMEQGKSDFILSTVDKSFQLRNAANAAHKMDSLIGSWIADPEHRTEQIVLKDGNIETADGIVGIERLLSGRELVPPVRDIHAESMTLETFRASGKRSYFETAGHMSHELGK